MDPLQFHNKSVLYIHSISTGFIEVPNEISTNIFVYGCQKRCAGCHNANLQAFKQINETTADSFKKILLEYPLSKWVCFLGGDAVYQKNGLEALAKASKESGRYVCLYTGMRYEDLDFLKKDDLDLIIDGEYNKNLGEIHEKTTNQRIFLRFRDIGFKCVNYRYLSEHLPLK